MKLASLLFLFVFLGLGRVQAQSPREEWSWNTGQTRLLFTFTPQEESGGGILFTPSLTFGQVEIRDPFTGLFFTLDSLRE